MVCPPQAHTAVVFPGGSPTGPVGACGGRVVGPGVPAMGGRKQKEGWLLLISPRGECILGPGDKLGCEERKGERPLGN